MEQVNANILDLRRLEIGQYDFDFRLDGAYLSAEDKSELLGGDVAVHASLRLSETSYDLHITVVGMVQVSCDRCLEPVDINVDAEDDFGPEEGTEEVDLAWLAYELIVVNLPLVHSHPDGGCNPEMAALLQSHLCSAVEEPEILS